MLPASPCAGPVDILTAPDSTPGPEKIDTSPEREIADSPVSICINPEEAFFEAPLSSATDPPVDE